MINLKKLLITAKGVEEIKDNIKKSFSNVKKELDVHLDSINQNTGEIQNLYDYMQEIDGKIEKLNERIDDLHLYLSPKITEHQLSVELSHREQEVFVLLYAAQDGISAIQIARKLGFTDEMVQRYVYNMIMKGIPILKQYEGDEMIFYLDLKFKDLQARKNILKLNDTITSQLMDDKAL
ncbi:hypothetical protein K9L67_03015 [Candidatus Woesearchaeota archaeon]|nr:hypothetical protein [Candidatus Woesearchaeota archaeon]MCF7901172.1 hypothetical protein [Candidatus Woesearchaeota archaeon]MCF8013814.1 hypothetical protein [Candidatus Woesearchaeota archaeon]